MTTALSRRRFLALSNTLAIGSLLAGCTTDGSTGSPTPAPATTDRPTPVSTPTDTASPTTTAAGTPEETPTPTKPTGDAVQWTTQIGRPIRHGPAIHDGVVYIGGGTNDRATSDEDYLRPDTSENVTAVDVDDGSHRWQYAATAGIMTTPVAHPTGVYVVIGWNAGTHGRGQRLLRIDSGGSVRWISRSVDSFLHPLTLTDDTVYLGTSDDSFGYEGERLWALQTADGNRRWAIEAGDTRTAVVRNERLYTVEGGRRTTAFATADGTEHWHRSMPPAGYALRVYGDSLYLRSQDQNDAGNYPIVAVAADDGSERWRFSVPVDEPFVPTGAVASEDTVYVTEYDGWVFAVAADDGTEQWRYSTDADTRDPPTCAAGTVFLPTMNGRIEAIDAATGQRRWSRDVGGYPRIVDTTASGLLVHGDAKGASQSIRFYGHDGTERWSFIHPSGLTTPVLTGHRGVVGTADGYLVAVGTA